MTVKQLIDQLRSLPPDMIVVVDGYEGGCHELQNPRVTNILLDYWTNAADYFNGPHEAEDHLSDYQRENFKIIQGLYLARPST